MEIEIYADNIRKEDCDLENHFFGCRGIIKKDNLFLMVYVKQMGIFTFPGGGLEEDETLKECVVREVLEETGIEVKVIEKKVSVTEYFVKNVWTNHYFICEYLNNDSKSQLTEEEALLGLEVVWKSFDEVLDIFENYQTLHEHGPNIHNREFLGFINSI